MLQGLLAQSPLLKGADVNGIALCSTVPSVLNEMREMCRRYYGDVTAVIVEPGVRTGVPVRMDNPKEVGSDRIVNALAAIHLYGGPCIIVDFGTATSFDAVSAKGEYIGRCHRPRHRDLRGRPGRGAAPSCTRWSWSGPRSVIAKNTVEALQSGIIYGFAGQVDGIVERMVGRARRRPRRGDRGGHRRRARRSWSARRARSTCTSRG